VTTEVAETKLPANSVTQVAANSSVTSATTSPVTPATSSNAVIGQSSHHDVVVVGGAVVDLIGSIHTPLARTGTSNPGTIRTTYGGVGRNIAESLARLGGDVTLATAVADDSSGRNIIERARHIGIDVSNFKILPSEDSDDSSSAVRRSTAVYNAIHDSSGELCIGIADMTIFSEISPQYIAQLADTIRTSRVVVSDGNISVEAFRALAGLCKQFDTALFFEPTSDHKCLLPFEAGSIDQVLCNVTLFYSVGVFYHFFICLCFRWT
jgi:sugar/nucleoside kinase (ribokinase family)